MNFNTFFLQENVSVENVSTANFNFLLPIKNNLQIYIHIYLHIIVEESMGFYHIFPEELTLREAMSG